MSMLAKIKTHKELVFSYILLLIGIAYISFFLLSTIQLANDGTNISLNGFQLNLTIFINLGFAVLLNFILIFYQLRRIVFDDSQQNIEYNRMVSLKAIQLNSSTPEINNPLKLFKKIVLELLELSGSEFGYIGEIHEDQDGRYLKTFYISDIAWDAASRSLYKPAGMEFRNLETLFGQVIKTESDIISNSPLTDNRSGGLPPGHPPLDNFWGIALKFNNELVGSIGLANRKGGFNEGLGKVLEPYFEVCSFLIWRNKENREKKSTENELSLVAKNMQDGLVTIDKNGRIKKINGALLNIFGYSEHELINKNVSIFMSDIDAKSHHNGVQNYLKSGIKKVIGAPPIRVQALHSSGRKMTVELSVNEIKFNDEIHFFAILRDISEKVRSEKEFERMAGELANLITYVGVPIIGLNSKGLIDEWNRTCENATGLNKQNVMNLDVIDNYVDDKSKDGIRKIVNAALKGKDERNVEFSLITSAKQIDLLMNFSPRRNYDGEITGVIGIGQDITQFKVEGAEIQQAQRLESIGLLTGGIAHDFNNLLTVILGNLDYLSMSTNNIDAEVLEVIEDAKSAAHDGSGLIKRLLSFTRNQKLTVEIVNVNSLLEKFVALVKRTLPNIEFTLDVVDIPILLRTDSSELESALLNLCINASDAISKDGKIALILRYVSADQTPNSLPDGHYAEIQVIDNGHGMDEETINRIFEPFYSTKDREKGSGLGLSMVHGFIHQSGGRVRVTSSVGKGTKVFLYLPVDTELRDFNEPMLKSNQESEAKLSKTSILVVEDKEKVRRFASRLLQSKGYEVHEADSADAAMNMLRKGLIVDVLFTDILMPGKLNGRELATLVFKEYQHIKILLSTGYEEQGEVNANDIEFPVLNKPYKTDQLFEAIKNL